MSGTRRISILGSTGSIGRNTLDIISRHPGAFEVVALAYRSDWETIANQAKLFKPAFVAIYKEESASRARDLLKGSGIEVFDGDDGILEAASTDRPTRRPSSQPESSSPKKRSAPVLVSSPWTVSTLPCSRPSWGRIAEPCAR